MNRVLKHAAWELQSVIEQLDDAGEGDWSAAVARLKLQMARAAHNDEIPQSPERYYRGPHVEGS